MQDRSVSIRSLLNATLRLLPQFLALPAVGGLACVGLYLLLGDPKFLAIAVAAFFALTFFAAPIASSMVRSRRGLSLVSRGGGTTLLYSFAWGSITAVLFIATLQVWQGMEATALNYLSTVCVGGLTCVIVASVPSGR